ncbi:actin depolymerizing protein [Punctularia strigosozonata HHB-11173 SS5]|uniref:actin depolymerizing protein n=1 Tax=Punctularia strigosozonata (strain HHB-11173) TaxID=741275 RepID=UPI000441809E|nr:actin depolymerizing protein [Punctularia strigosozonata HHB-11173 SS5]EIN07507.1 actin depolymerizing protein [Punctularia strigosozonata HHB-11173 SS5]
MSAASGIGVSPALSDAFAAAVDEPHTARFIKVAIRNESLVPDGELAPAGSFTDDLNKLQSLLSDDVPAYVLARLDDGAGWLAISYVPDTAGVRDKMLYASTRASLTKSLGAPHFTDTLFATSKSDLTPSGYAAHLAHLAAPKPMTPREQEAAAVRAAERAAGQDDYRGSGARVAHVGGQGAVGLTWHPDAEGAVRRLADVNASRIVVLTIEPATETLTLQSDVECPVDQLGAVLPTDAPCFAFFAWAHSASKREVVYVYSCPTGAPVKPRMVYSSAFLSTYNAARALLGETVLSARKVQTSDPREIDEAFLRAELGFSPAAAAPVSEKAGGGAASSEKKPFARPSRPGRR